MIRADKLQNVWVKYVPLVCSHSCPEVLRSAQSNVNLFWESCSEWFIYSFSSTKRPSQTRLMPMSFLQSKIHPNFPFRRAKKNKIGGEEKQHEACGDWKFIVLVNTELNK